MFLTEREYLKTSQELKLNLTNRDYQTYLNEYYVFFARYLVLLCADGFEKYAQVEELNYEEAINILKLTKCKRRIRSILIGEAPPAIQLNYFYNPSSPWNGLRGRPGRGQSFTTSIFDALFSGLTFPTKLDFLEECANSGFLLLDLFPFTINFSSIRTTRYFSALCASKFISNIIPFLQSRVCCIELDDSLGFAFAFKSSGEIILSDPANVTAFNGWQVSNGIVLDPSLPIDALRITTAANCSRYLRVCLKRYSLVPNSGLLTISGIR